MRADEVQGTILMTLASPELADTSLKGVRHAVGQQIGSEVPPGLFSACINELVDRGQVGSDQPNSIVPAKNISITRAGRKALKAAL
ncbi:MAG: hypothetical protein M3N08_07815 [Pseudomonadota bacterium]|nr:hypothetical protein [Pseudomonadota bacterium]